MSRSFDPGYWSEPLAQARAERFGDFMACWRKRCGWSQYELPKWGREAGFVTPSVGTMSQLERGNAKNPHMKLFAGLSEANRRLAAQDFSGVTSRQLLDRLQAGEPVVADAGQPWGFEQFVRAYHLPHQVSGEIWTASGRNANAAPALTAAELAHVNQAIADGFLEVARTIKPITRAMLQAVRVAPPGQRERYEDALSGLGYDAETLAKLWDHEAGDWLPLLWLQQLRQDLPPAV